MRRSALLNAMTRGASLCATLFLVGGCVAAGSITATPNLSPGSSTPTPPSQPTLDPTDGCGTGNLWVDYAPYTTATLASYGWSFVVADVKSTEPAIFNTADGKKPRGFMAKPVAGTPGSNGKIYTPVVVQVDRAISGQTKPGANRFLIEGGTIGCYTTRLDVSPNVEKGARYVFIVTAAQDADGKKLLDLQEAKFAWPVDANGVVQTVDGPQSIDALAHTVAQTAVAPSP
jgi:hypothetical protein